MSYKNLEIWQMARDISNDIHRLTLSKLPKFEMFEEGSQLRRSSKSVRSNIVEGYGRRFYVPDYLKHLIYAQASNDETIDHLEILLETGSLKDEALFNDLHSRLNILGRKLNKYISSIRSARNR